jgi:hypothetical protein
MTDDQLRVDNRISVLMISIVDTSWGNPGGLATL